MVVAIFNIELVVIPWILILVFNLFGSALRITAGIWATCEMCWWVYYSSWASSNASKIKSIAKAIELGEEVGPEFVSEVQETDAARKIIEFIQGHTLEKFDANHWQDSMAYVYIAGMLKLFGYVLGWLFILFIASIPFPGVWIPGLVISRRNNWKFGYLALFAGNFMKNYFYAYIWELFWPYRPYLFGFIGLIIVFVYGYKKFRRLTWKDLFLNSLVYFSRTKKNCSDSRS